MSYTHRPTAVSIGYRDEVITRQTDRLAEFSDEQKAIFKSRMGMVEGMYVIPELAQFAHELLKVNRRLRFAVSADSSLSSDDHPRIRIVDGLYAYYDGDRFSLAEIQYGQVGVTQNESKKFAVFSRKIRNEKFAPHRDQYYMVASVDVSKAVKNFMRYAIPYAPYEIAQMSLNKIADKVEAYRYTPMNVSRTSVRSINEHESFWADALRLYESGHRFSSPEVNREFERMAESRREQAERSGRGYHVCATEIRDDGKFALTVVRDVDQMMYKNLPPTASLVVTQEELPEVVQQRLALLSMMEHGMYVDDVGMRSNDWFYWVHIDGNEF